MRMQRLRELVRGGIRARIGPVCLALGWVFCGSPLLAQAQGCTITGSPWLALGAFLPLPGTGDVLTHSADSLQIACDEPVPVRLSVQGARSLLGPGSAGLPFSLSLRPGAPSDDLPAHHPGALLATLTGQHATVVVLYARLPEQSHAGQAPGVYGTQLVLTLSYD